MRNRQLIGPDLFGPNHDPEREIEAEKSKARRGGERVL